MVYVKQECIFLVSLNKDFKKVEMLKMRQDLKLFTNIAYFIALATIIVIPVCLFISSIMSDGSAASFLKLLASLTFLASMVGIPLSIVSMFSKEKLSKRILPLF